MVGFSITVCHGAPRLKWCLQPFTLEKWKWIKFWTLFREGTRVNFCWVCAVTPKNPCLIVIYSMTNNRPFPPPPPRDSVSFCWVDVDRGAVLPQTLNLVVCEIIYFLYHPGPKAFLKVVCLIWSYPPVKSEFSPAQDTFLVVKSRYVISRISPKWNEYCLKWITWLSFRHSVFGLRTTRNKKAKAKDVLKKNSSNGILILC